MGPWVLRTDQELDHAALIHATQKLVDRHAALRVRIADPINYWSLVCTQNLLINWSTSELNTLLNPTTYLGDTGC